MSEPRPWKLYVHDDNLNQWIPAKSLYGTDRRTSAEVDQRRRNPNFDIILDLPHLLIRKKHSGWAKQRLQVFIHDDLVG